MNRPSRAESNRAAAAAARSHIIENVSLDLDLGGQRVGIVLNRGATTAKGTDIQVELIRLQAADGSWTFFVNTAFPTL